MRLESALTAYDNLLNQIEDQAALIQATYNLNADEINVLNESRSTQQSLNDSIRSARDEQSSKRSAARWTTIIANAAAEMMNDVPSTPFFQWSTYFSVAIRDRFAL